MKRDPRNLLAIAFVVAGVLPVVIWLIRWAQQSLTFELAVQVALIAVLFVVLWRIRVAWENKHPGRRR